MEEGKYLERRPAVQVVVLVRAELVAADVGLQRLEVGLDLVVADQAEAGAKLRRACEFIWRRDEEALLTVKRRRR